MNRAPLDFYRGQDTPRSDDRRPLRAAQLDAAGAERC
jgi:hypothetical protein